MKLIVHHQKQVLTDLVQAANDMASAASIFGSHGARGYESFIESRDHFMSLVSSLKEDIESVDKMESFRSEACSGCYKRSSLVLV